jgi:cytochrome c biogenesis protein CcmG/thiol:disulfide interchange protein DsbE
MTDTAAPQAPKVKRWPYLLPLAVVAVLAGLFGKRLLDVEHGIDPGLIPTVLLDTPAPILDLPALPGRGEALRSDDFKGQVTLVNFWGSWCIACVAEHPMLLEIAKSGVVKIQGVAWRDEPDASLAWLAKHGDPFDKIGQDPGSHAAIAFGVVAAPESFVIDKNGVIRYKEPGIITREKWLTRIKPLIEQLNK